MAVKVLRATIPRDVGRSVTKSLVISPKPKQIYRSGQGLVTLKAKDPVKFFVVDGEFVHLPIHTAREFELGPFSSDAGVRAKHESFEETQRHVRVPTDRAVFTGSLLPRQVEPMKCASEILARAGMCLFGMNPGFGKTACTAYQIARCGLRAVIFCHREFLVNQWMGTFEKLTNMRAVAWTSKAAALKKQPNWDEVDVLVSMDTCAGKIPRTFLDSVGFLALDEAHLLCTTGRIGLFFCTRPRYVVACSATLDRTDEMQKIVHRACGTEGIKFGNTVPYKLRRVRTPFVPDTGEGDNLNWTTVTESLSTNEERNRAIARLAADLTRARGEGDSTRPRKVLLMTRRADHVEVLENLLRRHGVELVSTMYRSKTTYRDAEVLVATLSKVSVGFDEENACADEIVDRIDTLILCSSIAEAPALIQTFGRVFRSSSPEIYYLVDRLRTIEKHWDLAKRYAAESYGEVSDFEIEPYLDPATTL